MSDENFDPMEESLRKISRAPSLSPEQSNAIDLLILGKTDREVSELVGFCL
jgi:hypothetical protein